MQNRYIVKKLYEFAVKEYREKRPTEIIGYRVKKSVLLQRGFGPTIILSGLKGQVVPFLIMADYGEHLRLYYILETGAVINAINLSKQAFGLEQLKFEKATKKLFQIPKPAVPKKRLERIKRQLNDKFQQYITTIEKRTSSKAKKIPLITVFQEPIAGKIVIKRERNIIKFPIELIAHPLVDGYILREAYKLFFPVFIKKSHHAFKLGLIGAYFLLKKSLKQDWLRHWEKKYQIKDQLVNLTERQFMAYLNYLQFLGSYESIKLPESKLEQIHLSFLKLSGNLDSHPEIAAETYLEIANHGELFHIKAALFYLLSSNLKSAKKVMKSLAKFASIKDYQTLRTYCDNLASLHLTSILNTPLDFTKISKDIQKLFEETLIFVKRNLFEVQRTHPQKFRINEPVKIIIQIRNLTDLTFNNVKLVDKLSKKTNCNILSSNSFYIHEIRPNEKINCNYEISCPNPKKILFNNGTLTFEDTFGNHYIQILPLTTLHPQ